MRPINGFALAAVRLSGTLSGKSGMIHEIPASAPSASNPHID
jgi:hypothetical protein